MGFMSILDGFCTHVVGFWEFNVLWALYGHFMVLWWVSYGVQAGAVWCLMDAVFLKDALWDFEHYSFIIIDARFQPQSASNLHAFSAFLSHEVLGVKHTCTGLLSSKNTPR